MKYVLVLASAAGVALGISSAVAQCGGQCRSAPSAPVSYGSGHGFAVAAAPAGGCSMGSMAGMSAMPALSGMPSMPTMSGMPTMNGMSSMPTMPATVPAATPVSVPSSPATGHEHHHGMAAPAAPAVAPTNAPSPASGGEACPKCKTAAAPAAVGKEVKLTGTLVYTKCSHTWCPLAGKILDAVVVNDGDKHAIYLLADKTTGEAFASGVAPGTTGVSVTGTVTESDGMKYLKPIKVTVQ